MGTNFYIIYENSPRKSIEGYSRRGLKGFQGFNREITDRAISGSTGSAEIFFPNCTARACATF
jgi:hypothetical protein